MKHTHAVLTKISKTHPHKHGLAGKLGGSSGEGGHRVRLWACCVSSRAWVDANVCRTHGRLVKADRLHAFTGRSIDALHATDRSRHAAQLGARRLCRRLVWVSVNVYRNSRDNCARNLKSIEQVGKLSAASIVQYTNDMHLCCRVKITAG